MTSLLGRRRLPARAACIFNPSSRAGVLEEAESLCRNVTIIDHGRIVEHGPMKQVLAKLDVEAFVLDLESPLANGLPDVEGARFSAHDDHTLEVEMPHSMDLNRIFTALSEAGIRVRSMRTKSNRLEELFMRMTQPGRDAVSAKEAQA